MKRISIILLFLALWAMPSWAASGKITTNGSDCSTATNCLVVSLPQDKGGATLTLSGSWTGTISFEATGDGGATWVSVSVTPLASTTTVTSTTAGGVWQVNMSGFTGIRMRASAAITGTAVATITPSTASARNAGGGGGGSGGDTITSPNSTLTVGGTSSNTTLDVTAPLPVAYGGTNAITKAAALVSLFPAGTRVGDVLYCSAYSAGACTAWTAVAGNNSGTSWLQETSGGAPSWTVPPGGLTVAGSSGDLQMNNGSSNLAASHVNDNGAAVYFSEPTSYYLATAGTGGVTQNLLAAVDASSPSKFVLPASGNCGIGFALTSAAANGTFLLGSSVQEDYTGIADNNITAGNILVGGTTTPGRVKDSAASQITGVPVGTCIVGKALTTATTGNPVTVIYMGLGTFGTSGQATYTGSVTAGQLASWTGTGGQLQDTTAMAVGSGQTLTVQSGGTLTCAAGSTCPTSAAKLTVGNFVPTFPAIATAQTWATMASYAGTFPANFNSAGVISLVKCGTNPGGTVVFTLRDVTAAADIGTVSVSSSCVGTFATTGGTTQAVSAGDFLTVVSGTDATAVNVVIDFKDAQ